MDSIKIIHLFFKETNEHHYFGSLLCIYDHFTAEQVGVAYNTLRTYKLPTDSEPYENDKCVIRKGKVLRKKRKA